MLKTFFEHQISHCCQLINDDVAHITDTLLTFQVATSKGLIYSSLLMLVLLQHSAICNTLLLYPVNISGEIQNSQ